MRSISLQLKLPLLISGLLLVVLAGLAWTVYRESRRVALGVTGERQAQVTKQLSDLFDNSSRQLGAAVGALARDSAVRAYFRAPTPANRRRAIAVLERRHGQNQVAGVELADSLGRRLVATRDTVPPIEAGTVRELGPSAQPDTGRVGPLRQAGDSLLLYPVVAAVTDGGRLRGYVIERRRVAGSRQASEQLSQLVGSQSRLLLGNADGGLWTDFASIAQGPPLEMLGADGHLTYTRSDGVRALVVARRMARAPWMLVVEFPERAALAPARALLTRVMILAASFLILGALGAWVLSRHMTGPLRQLTGAATAIAAGDLDARVKLARGDELGQLADAFAVMMDRLAAAHHQLEAKVEQRTSALQESKATLQAVLDNMADGVVVADERGKFTLWNRAAEHITGMGMTDTDPSEWPVTYGVFQTDQETPFPADEQPLVRATKGEATDEVELFIRNPRRPEGVFVSVSGRPLADGKGHLRGGVVVFRDITERRQAQEQLQVANRELEAFSYSVSHDLRAPLRAVDGFSRILVEDHASDLGGDAKRLLDVIRDNTKRMGQLIDDLLAFSRLSRTEMAHEDVNMSALARAAIDDLLRDGTGTKPQVAVAQVPPARGDTALLRQVWLNLLGNAVKFSRTNQQPRVEVGSEARPAETVYFVRDNGVGFDMAYADKLFGVFQRLHRQEEFEGTGVGLAIVQRVIHRHGGRVWADATPGAGATFFFSLPRTEI